MISLFFETKEIFFTLSCYKWPGEAGSLESKNLLQRTFTCNSICKTTSITGKGCVGSFFHHFAAEKKMVRRKIYIFT